MLGRAVVLALLCALAPRPSAPVADAATGCRGVGWTVAWSAADQGSSLQTQVGPAVLRDRTAREIVTPHRSGTELRLHLSNRFGMLPVTLDDVRVARQASGASTVAGSDRPVTVAGSSSITLAPGAEVTTDAVPLVVRPWDRLLVSLHATGSTALDQHVVAMRPTWLSAESSGDHAGDSGDGAFSVQQGSVYALTAVDLLAPRTQGAVVALGDSLTDGIGSSLDGDARWIDDLSRSLLAGGRPATVVGAGISGNEVLHDSETDGPAAEHRLDTDVLSLAGVSTAIVFEGINDLNRSSAATPAADLEAGLASIAATLHAHGLRVLGATITPDGGYPTADVLKVEPERQEVNRWIRTSGTYDDVLDFDAAVRDPDDGTRLRPELDVDHLHLNDAGYRALAAVAPAASLQPRGCLRPVGVSGLPSRIDPGAHGFAVAPALSGLVDTGHPGSDWTLTVRGSTGTVLRRTGHTGDGLVDVEWDGLDDGRPVADGTYTWILGSLSGEVAVVSGSGSVTSPVTATRSHGRVAVPLGWRAGPATATYDIALTRGGRSTTVASGLSGTSWTWRGAAGTGERLSFTVHQRDADQPGDARPVQVVAVARRLTGTHGSYDLRLRKPATVLVIGHRSPTGRGLPVRVDGHLVRVRTTGLLSDHQVLLTLRLGAGRHVIAVAGTQQVAVA